jgi:23S rRNA pseudouridine2605 synthase
MEEPDAVRLQLRLSRAGIASRRKCEEFIAEGRVSVNGHVITKPGTKVTPEDDILFDGRPVRDEKRKVYVALHKPAGFLCSDEDPDGRPLAKSLLDVVIKERIYHVGRLDYMTSGLIFYTNDGDFARALTHPSKKVEKEYVVTAKSEIPKELMSRFLEGITVEGVRYRASQAVLDGPRTARIVLTEGKNKELRRVFLSSSVSIKKVHRVRIGPVSIKGINSGHFRHLRESEIKALMSGKSVHKNAGEHRRPQSRGKYGSRN